MTNETWLILGVVLFACGVLGAVIAGRKGMSQTVGFFAGLLLGPFGLVLVLLQSKPVPVEWDTKKPPAP